MAELTQPLSINDISQQSTRGWWHWKRPDARNDDAKTDEDTPETFNILANDKWADGFYVINEVVYSTSHSGGVTLSSGAILSWEKDGTVKYDPNGQFDYLDDGETATDHFAYVAYNGWGYDKAEVTVTIHGVSDHPGSENTPPVAVNDYVSVPGYPYPYPYPKPYPLPLAENETTDLAVAAAEGVTIDPDAPIVTTMAIGEEGPPPDWTPSQVDIDVLANDKDLDQGPEALSIATVNGQTVGVGDTVTLPSGATVTVDTDNSLIYRGGILGYSGLLPPAEETYGLVSQPDGGAPSIEALTLPTPLPSPIPYPYLADTFTYQASDGEDLSKLATVIVTRTYAPIYLAEDTVDVPLGDTPAATNELMIG